MSKSVPEAIPDAALAPADVLTAVDLVKNYPVRGKSDVVHAVRGVTFRIHANETLGLVGETGCGKTTVGRCVTGLLARTSGDIHFRGEAIAEREKQSRSTGKVQMVFQNPGDSLNPGMTVSEILHESLRAAGERSVETRTKRAHELMHLVSLDDRLLGARSDKLTSGEQQRVSIARAVSVDPLLIVLDEPTSNLDLVARQQILELLGDLQAELGTSYLLISHDLKAIARLSHRIAVMYLGQIVEEGPTEEVLHRPAHPYTVALMSSVLPTRPGKPSARVKLKGEVPSAINPPEGCPLNPRCPFAVEECLQPQATVAATSPSHSVACHRSHELPELIGQTK